MTDQPTTITGCATCDHEQHEGQCGSCGCRPGIAWRCWKGKCGEAYEQGGYGVTCTHQPAVDDVMAGFLRVWAAHENAPRTTCAECHFESSEGYPPSHAPGCSRKENRA